MERDGALAPSLSAVFFFYMNFATSSSGNLVVMGLPTRKIAHTCSLQISP
ncbi:hypothetical protein [Bacillus sp. B4EP4a]|nr:hypothetical protein [Bacillus sp. B4EP4a]